ncbi:Cytochrome P450 monooxygenase aneD [Fulvia fulva]|uniref:Cytochrome P450 monooxygenase aneD n=1 Tax=Passalora fulva TaxID=5499 RepID=A0A9Q8P8A0_PASFU|nr:Cytochrome P450 monooxygenase aneD [Fulvia fulva]KAK4626561.1 Cytochrome P450 monooxygenase aneD [Fulvia fulva]KAK4627652.1 Cytochrome P450 monooxygenase aneD [Fulvia fulva]UJO16772.1 Cytochrome P450 monooxygenase aneD [Fulvia fulva]WPV13465.1 Cytochrome P450 monooxygenase aneD [Fulvia fulva]WPV28732.1 Cytochrome P450 monooxygenase aneD [Fulvia fulva]
MPIAGNLVSKGMRSVTQPTRVWSELRRMMRPLLNTDFTKRFIDWQEYESMQMLQAYLDDSSTWYLHNSRYATGVMYGIIAGERLSKTDAEMQEYRRTTMEFLASIQSTAVDFFPFLEYLPRSLQVWRHKWEAMGARHYQAFTSWWHPIKTQATGDKAQHSWVKQVILGPTTNFLGNEDEAAYLTNTLISAGGDNPRIALNTCLMASIVHTSACHHVRTEIDTVCHDPDGSLRLPATSDIPQMPYTCAFIKECLRYYPVVPMVPPHTAAESFSFEQYTFPKGTSFILNIPTITRDYLDPQSFQPERWIDGRGGEAKLTEAFWGFGGGKRVCIGYKAAQTGLFLPFARLMMCFEVGKAGDFDDRRVNAWSSGEPFPLMLRLREEEYRELILRKAKAKKMPE